MTASATSLPSASRRELLVGGAFACAAAAAGALRLRSSGGPGADRVSLDRLIPDSIGQWVRKPLADVVIPRGETAEDNTYDDVFTSFYESSSATGIMLLVAYGSAQIGDTELHRPEVCYPAAGFHLRRWPDVTLQFPGERVRAAVSTATAPERTEQMLYWSRIGADYPTSSLEQRWSILRQAVRGTVPDGVLVRMSTIESDSAAGLETLKQFAGAMVASASPTLRQMLVGRS